MMRPYAPDAAFLRVEYVAYGHHGGSVQGELPVL